MEILLASLDQQNAYKLIVGSIVPRPIAWVSTLSTVGARNLAPFSFFNAIGSNPPALVFSTTYSPHTDHRKDTLRNILDTKEFVVNIVDEALAPAMNTTATDYPDEIDEFAVAQLEAAPSRLIKPPRVAAAPVSFECSLFTTVPVGEGPGSATLVVGTILVAHVRDDLIDDRYRIDVHKLQPVGRLAGNDYVYVRDVFSLARRRYNRETGQVE